MNTLLVNNGAARKLRSLFFLLFMVGVVNVASAATYYTGTTGTASITSGYIPTNIFTDAAATTPRTTALVAADVIIVQGATLTINASINVNATSGGLTVFGGTATISATSTFSAAVTVSGTTTGITVAPSVTLTINSDVTIGTGGTFSLNSTSTTAGFSTVTVSGNLIMTGGTLNLAQTGGCTFRFSGNLAGDASAGATTTGWGLITGRGAAGSGSQSNLIFNASANLGTGGAASANTVTTGSDAIPQLVNFINGTSVTIPAVVSSTSTANSFFVRISGYVKLTGNSALPQGCGIIQVNANSLIDLNGYNLSMGFFSGTPVIVRGGSYNSGNNVSSLQLNSTWNGASSNGGWWGRLATDQTTPGTTNLVNLNLTMGGSYSATNIPVMRAVQLANNLATNYTTTLTNVTGATGQTTITCASTAGLAVGTFVSKASGTGVFAANTFVTSIINSTSFTVSSAPTTAFVSGDVVSVRWLTSGVVYLNGYSVSGPNFPTVSTTANNNSLFSIGGTNSTLSTNTSATINTFIGGSIIMTTPSASGSSVLPLGIPTAASGAAVNSVNYTPVTFNTTTAASTPSLTASVSALNASYLTLTGASGASGQTTVTCNSTTGLAVGSNVTVLTGVIGSTGAFAVNTTVTAIASATSFTVSANIATTLATATIVAYYANPYNLTSALGTSVSSTGTTVTCASTAGLQVGAGVTVTAGTGAFAANTTVSSITNATTFVVSATPTTALSGATIATSLTVTGASGSGTTITCNSTSGLAVGNAVTVSAGTGAFPIGTTVTSITNSTTFEVSAAPSVTLSGATISSPTIASNLFGNGTGVSTGVVPYQWSIASSLASTQSNITFQFPSATGFTSPSSTTQLGVVSSSNKSGFNGIASATTLTSAGTTPITTTASSFTLPGTANSTNTYVIGNAGTVLATALNYYYVVGNVSLNGTTVTYTTANISNASGSGTTITCASTSGLYANQVLTGVTGGTGTLAAGTYIVSITNGTQFVVNTAPSVALSGATVTASSALYTNSVLTAYTNPSTILTTDLFYVTTANSTLATVTSATTLGGITMSAGNVNLGTAYTGSFTATGGTLTVAGGSITLVTPQVCTLALTSGSASLGANLTGNITISGGTLTTTSASTISGSVTLSGTGVLTNNATTTVSSNVTIGSGSQLTLGTNGMTVSGNLFITGGTLALAGNTLTLAGNLAGSSDLGTQGTGTITATANTGAINFSGGSLGTSPTTSTSSIVLGTSPNPQKVYVNFTATGGALFRISNHVQIVGSTSFVNGRIAGNSSSAVNSLLDLNGYQFSTGWFAMSSGGMVVVRGSNDGNSVLELIGNSAGASQINFDQSVPGTTNFVNLKTTLTSAAASFRYIILGTNLYVSSGTTLTNYPVYLNGFTVTGASFPTASSTSYFALGTNGTAYAAGSTNGGALVVANPSTATITLPLGYSNGASGGAVYTPIAFANTTPSPATLRVAVAPLSTADVFASVSSIPYEWSITSSTASVSSDITFYSTSATGITSTSQLGVLSGNPGTTAGYISMTTNLATASSFNASSFFAKFNGYTLPANTTVNSFVVGARGSVYPLVTLTSIGNQSYTIGNAFTPLNITGTNITNLSANNLPAGLGISLTDASNGTTTGTPTDNSFTQYSTTITASNPANSEESSFTYTIGSNPSITSAATGTAIKDGTFSYTITATSGADQFNATSLPTGLLVDAATGVISGTITGAAGSYTIPLTATNTTSGLSNAATNLVLRVLDKPTVSSISPKTSTVDTITSGTITLTVNGTNFVNGFSSISWSGTNLTTSFVSSTQLTALVPASLLARTTSASIADVVVKNSGTNASPTTPSTPNVSSDVTSNSQYSLTIPTPTVTALSPAVSVVGGPELVVTVYGSNFIPNVSQVTFGGSTTGITTTAYYPATGSGSTFIAARLIATISSSVFNTTAGLKTIGVTNSGAGLSSSSTATNNFTLYADGAVWTLSNTGVPVTATGSNVTATTLTIASNSTTVLPFYSGSTSFTATGLKYTPSISGTATTWPIDDKITNGINSLFDGLTVNNNGGTQINYTPRYIQFSVPTKPGFNFQVSNITIPITNNTTTLGLIDSIAYSLDGFTTTSGIVKFGATPGQNTYGSLINFSYTPSTPIVVPAGSTLSVRVIPYTGKNGVLGNASILIGNVVIAGTTSAAYNSPVISPAVPTTVTGDAAIDYGSVANPTPLYTFTASTVNGIAPTYSASGLAGTGYAINATTGAITGQSITAGGGSFNVVFTADNGNLFPTVSSSVNFIIDGQALTPTTTSISPTTGAVDGAQFTITVNGTNFTSGKSTVTWTASGTTTNLATTYVSATQLTAVVPPSLLAASTVSTTSATPSIGVYNTGATVPASNTQTYTINNLTPTIIALSDAGVNAGNAGFTLAVYGTNFTTASKITWGGTQLTTTFVSTRQITASISSANVASVGKVAIGVTNVFPSTGSISSAATISFAIGNAISKWSTTSLTPSSVGSVVGSNTTLNGTANTAAIAGVYSFGTTTGGSTSGTAYPADGGNATVNSTFTGVIDAISVPASPVTSTRSIDFKVTAATQKDLTISAFTVPVYATTSQYYYSVAYSTDGVNFTKVSTASNSGGVTATNTTANTNDIQITNTTANTVVTSYVFPTDTLVSSGKTFTVRVIVWRKAGNASTSTVNIGSVSIVGNTSAVATPYAPTITTLDDGSNQVDVSFTPPSYAGTSAITSYKVYAYANGSTTPATSATVNVVGGIAPTHILVTGLTNNTVSYTFKVTAINASGEGVLSAASLAVTPSNNTTWTVTNGVGRWDHGDPDAGDQNATINGNFTLTKALNCLKLTVANNVTVALGNFNFTVQGNMVNNGTLTGSGTLFLNSTSVTTITGTGTVGNVTINNTSGGVSVTAGNMFNVSGVLTLQSGALTTNSCVTLKSTSIANTGTLAAYGVSGNTGTISGTVTVERYIPAGFRGYRDLAPQVNNAGSIYNNWQEGGKLPSSPGYRAGYGIFITGPSAINTNASNYVSGQANADATSGQLTPASSGLDYSLNGNSSAFTFNNSNGTFYSLYAAGKIDSIYNTNTINLFPFTGYRVLVRGDRSFNLANTPIVNYYNFGLRMVNPTVLRATGNLITGTVTYATNGVTNASVGATYQSATYGLNGTTSKFSMIANPYAAPVLWGTGTNTNSNSTTVFGASSNINGSYWYYDTKFGSTGTYAAYNAQTGSVYAGNTTSGYIQPGQAFFVQTSGSNPTVVFKETAKETSVAKVAVFGAAAPLSKIYISLLKQNASNNYNTVDAAAIAFHEGFTNTNYGSQDALKYGNNSDNLSISDKGTKLSIDGRLPATSTDKIQLAIGNVIGTSYQLDIDATNYASNGFEPYLVDSYKGTTATLTSGLNSFKFTVDAKVAASFENRFSIAFKPTTLAVNSIVASATLNNKIATISWNTVGEKGVSRFEVEKSTDAKNFVKIGQTSAKNTATASYTSTDNSVSATTYYRVKAINEIGTVSYSNVAQLTVNSKQFTVYPNPFVGKTLSVTFGNISTGKYTVTINNVLGQRVQEVAISHAGGTVSHAITVNNKLAAGNYSITIRETASGQLVHQTNLSVQP